MCIAASHFEEMHILKVNIWVTSIWSTNLCLLSVSASFWSSCNCGTHSIHHVTDR
uniref:Uncharacterized protein n=1 Tax=Anguilla anguilla TaxID=7936 RepID=A0A0E9PF61_ANGAN